MPRDVDITAVDFRTRDGVVRIYHNWCGYRIHAVDTRPYLYIYRGDELVLVVKEEAILVVWYGEFNFPDRKPEKEKD